MQSQLSLFIYVYVYSFVLFKDKSTCIMFFIPEWTIHDKLIIPMLHAPQEGDINPLNPDYNVSHRDDGNVLFGLYCICHLDIIITQWK